MSALTLPVASSIPTLSQDQYCLLTSACRAKFDALRDCLRRVPNGHGKRRIFSELAEIMLSRGYAIGAESLKRFYYGIPSGNCARPGYITHGEFALVDHRLCGGCGLSGCNAPRRVTLSQETVDEWIRLAEDNDKRSLSKAWRDLMENLQAGEVIRGAGSWRTIYTTLNPGRALPAQCPYSRLRPPSGWSLSSFFNRLPEDYEYELGKKGLFAAENLLAKVAPVRTDLSTLRFMEVVVFDDHRLDFKAWVGSQIVELWGVFAMDLATRTILAWGVRPRIVSDDGVKQSLTRRDVQHLCAGLLQTHGVPMDYQMTWLVENAAAAITGEFERTLERMLPGRIYIDRAAVGDGRARGWNEKYGKPRDKRWLESFFNLLEIELGSTPGQMGNKWENKPGDFDHRQNIGGKLARSGVLALLPDSVKPFNDLEAARLAVHDALLRCENRLDHELVGFQQRRFWRINDADAWKCCNEPFFLALPLEQQNALMASRDTGLLRNESPAEKRQRLRDPSRFERLSDELCFELYLDAVETVYKGAGCLTFKFADRTFDFSGSGGRWVIGEKVVVRFDADRPTACVVMDLQGRVLGSMQQRNTPGFFEREKIAEEMGDRQKALGKALRNVRTRHADPNQAADYMTAVDIVTTQLGKPEKEIQAAMTTPVLATYSEAMSAPQASSAEDYLQLAKHRNATASIEPPPEPAPQDDEEEGDGYGDAILDPNGGMIVDPAW